MAGQEITAELIDRLTERIERYREYLFALDDYIRELDEGRLLSDAVQNRIELAHAKLIEHGDMPRRWQGAAKL